MALGLLFVESLGHAAEHAGVDDLLIGGAAHTFEDGAQLLGSGNVLGEVVVDAAGLQQSVQTLQLLGVGLFMDAVNEGDLLDAGKVGSALVGQQHKLLDHALALAGSALLDVDTTAILVEDELDFAALDVHAAALLTQAGAVAVQLLHSGQLVDDVGILCLDLGVGSTGQQGVDLGVDALDAAADDGLDKAVIRQITLLVQTHQAGESQTQLVLVQAADAVGQGLGQHRNDLICIIDAGCAAERLVVQLGAGLDVVGDVCDVDAQLKAAVRGAGQADGIVDVLGLGTVDGEDGQGAQVHAALAVLLGDLCALELLGLIPHFIREAGADVLCVKQSLGAALGLVGAAEAHGNAHAVVFLTVAAVQDLDGYLVAVLCAALAVAGQRHGDGRAVVRHEAQTALDPAHSADQVVFLGQDGEDSALVAALHTGMLEFLHQHVVAGHCALGEAAGDEDVAGAVLQHDEGKVLAQLDHLAQQSLVGTAGADGKEHALTLADDSLSHQFVQSFHHLAVCAALAAELLLQLFDGAGLVLDGMFDFIAH